MYKVSTLDPMKVDPNVLRIALRIPNTLKEGEKGVSLSLSSWRGKDKDKPLKVPLTKVENKGFIKSYEKDGYNLYVYEIADTDAKKLTAFRKKYRKQLSEGSNNIKTKFAISSHICRTLEIKDKPLLVSLWIKVDNTSNFLPILTDFDTREVLKMQEINKKKCMFWGAVVN